MLKHPLTIKLTDLAIFQGIWWLAALWGNSAILGLLTLLGLHLLLLSAQLKRDSLAVLVLASLGWGIDLSLQIIGFWDLHSALPAWLLVIWAGFILSLFYSLAWLQPLKPLYQAAIGGVAGALSYWAGAKMGALSFNYSLPVSLITLITGWAVILPLFLQLIKRFEHHFGLAPVTTH